MVPFSLPRFCCGLLPAALGAAPEGRAAPSAEPSPAPWPAPEPCAGAAPKNRAMDPAPLTGASTKSVADRLSWLHGKASAALWKRLQPAAAMASACGPALPKRGIAHDLERPCVLLPFTSAPPLRAVQSQVGEPIKRSAKLIGGPIKSTGYRHFIADQAMAN